MARWIYRIKKGYPRIVNILRFGDFCFCEQVNKIEQVKQAKRGRMKSREFDRGWWRSGVCITGLVLGLAVDPVLAQTSVSRDIEAPVQKAVDTRQAAQKAQEKWDEQRIRLVAAYERLKAENEQLTAARDRLSKEAARQKNTNQALAAEQEEAQRIQSEMQPFLKEVVDRMTRLLAGDAPFLSHERTTRLTRLSAVLDDPEISVAEKYRKTMEALFVEAEYGNTIEVYQEKIYMENAEVLGNIFRLGRVSLFFLSLDRETAAVFNMADGQWTALDASHVPNVVGAVDMAAKHRPMEVIALPVGRLAQGGQHE